MSQALASAAQRQAGSAAAARTPTAITARASAPRPKLRIVPQPALDRARGAFLLSCVVLLLAGLIALLLINTSLAQGSFRLHDLEQEQRDFVDTEQALRQDLARQAAPEVLARRAKALGMVPSDNPAFVVIPGGKIVGVPKTARRPTPLPGAAASPR